MGQKLPNAFGLYDMSGNVSEWCEDDEHFDYTNAPEDGRTWVDSPRSPFRHFRGGSFPTSNYTCRSAFRLNQASPKFGYSFAGFRLSLLNEPAAGTEETVLLPNGVPLTMVYVREGTFSMGRDPGDQSGWSDEEPQHEVLVPGFWMAKHELTKRQWKAVMNTEPWSGLSNVLNDLDSPAVYVSWDDAKSFLTVLNAYTGKVFRLPSEAEWEYACRAETATRFYWGADPYLDDSLAYCWWWYNAENVKENCAHVVGQKLPNGFGLYDMSGNVWEWCEDDYHLTYTGAPGDGRALVDLPRSTLRALRGGSWDSFPGYECRSARRGESYPYSTHSVIGFRVAR